MIDIETIKQRNFFLQEFAAKLNLEPAKNEVEKTPDGKAWHIPIGIIEMKLDQIFFGLWQTHSFQTSIVANEVVGSIVLECTHPVTGDIIRRTGAASIQIMVDALTDEEKRTFTKKEKNSHSLDVQNKKPNALDLAYPKLKTECIKNAALSLGKTFGRDLNRKIAPAEFKRSVQKPSKPELNESNIKWSIIVAELACEAVTIEQLKGRFEISETIKQKLIDDVFNYQQHAITKGIN